MNIRTRRDDNRTPLETVIPLVTPYIVFIDPSDMCNFKCKFCPTGNRELMATTPGRNSAPMSFNLYKKIIDDMRAFPTKLKVLRLYKDGEPLLNNRFADMVKYAKDANIADRIDTTTNAALLTRELSRKIIDAGLTRINISIEGMSTAQYKQFSDANVDFDALVKNISYLCSIRGKCEIIIKINGDTISEVDADRFLAIFGEMCDGVSIEHVMSCWPEFELGGDLHANKELGIYGQPTSYVDVCPYIFYAMSVNSNGTVSACFLDWSRKLIIGDTRTTPLASIWNSKEMQDLRIAFLRKKRKEHPFCKDCAQLTHGAPDNIDQFADILLKKATYD